jgi:hypothetical protein
MRTTVDLDPDVLAAVEKLRDEEKVGLSAAVNTLVRRGLTAPRADYVYVPRSFPLGLKIDITHVGEALELLDELEAEDRRAG